MEAVTSQHPHRLGGSPILCSYQCFSRSYLRVVKKWQRSPAIGKIDIFTSGSIIELGWAFYDIIGIHFNSSDSEVVRKEKKKIFCQIKILLIWGCQILKNTRFSLIFCAIFSQYTLIYATLRYMGI